MNPPFDLTISLESPSYDMADHEYHSDSPHRCFNSKDEEMLSFGSNLYVTHNEVEENIGDSTMPDHFGHVNFDVQLNWDHLENNNEENHVNFSLFEKPCLESMEFGTIYLEPSFDIPLDHPIDKYYIDQSICSSQLEPLWNLIW